ncbi:MAG TPA: hypothetical protein DCM40_16720, partial [Maribacter sp.]|nr:hypothetical protein [Maribacter sp.]
ENETKQLGQDILDSAFSIGDAVVYAFRKNICLNGPDELLEEDYQLGLRAAPDASPEVSSRPRNLRTREGRNTIRQMATEQAFATIEDTDQIFQSLCAKIADFGNLGNMGGAGSVNLDLLWTQGFDKIKTCGMFDFAIEASHCLLKGLSLEEAGASILKAAIRGMNLDNLSDFFLNQLPPEK